jgi:hypothetical protein
MRDRRAPDDSFHSDGPRWRDERYAETGYDHRARSDVGERHGGDRGWSERVDRSLTRYGVEPGHAGGRGYTERAWGERGWGGRPDVTTDAWRPSSTRRGELAAGDERDERSQTRPVGRPPKSYVRSDARVREDVCERLWATGDDWSELEIEVTGGDVVLRGRVSSLALKHLAERIAAHARGVLDVDNRLRVGPVERVSPAGVESDDAPPSTPRRGRTQH